MQNLFCWYLFWRNFFFWEILFCRVYIYFQRKFFRTIVLVNLFSEKYWEIFYRRNIFSRMCNFCVDNFFFLLKKFSYWKIYFAANYFEEIHFFLEIFFRINLFSKKIFLRNIFSGKLVIVNVFSQEIFNFFLNFFCAKFF